MTFAIMDLKTPLRTQLRLCSGYYTKCQFTNDSFWKLYSESHHKGNYVKFSLSDSGEEEKHHF